jgi:hypothetical protein
MNDDVVADAVVALVLLTLLKPCVARRAITLGRLCRSVDATARRHPLRVGWTTLGRALAARGVVVVRSPSWSASRGDGLGRCRKPRRSSMGGPRNRTDLFVRDSPDRASAASSVARRSLRGFSMDRWPSSGSDEATGRAFPRSSPVRPPRTVFRRDWQIVRLDLTTARSPNHIGSNKRRKARSAMSVSHMVMLMRVRGSG